MSHDSADFDPIDPTQRVVDYLTRSFGVPEQRFAELRFWQRRGVGTIWCTHVSVELPAERVEAPGLLVMRDPLPRGVLANDFIRRFLSDATRNVVDLDDTEAATFLEWEPVAWRWDPAASPVQVVRWQGLCLGRGRRRGELLLSELAHPNTPDRRFEVAAHGHQEEINDGSP